MKRSRKTLFALLLALVMTLGLAATAWATSEGVPADTLNLELTITKMVEQGGNVAPPAETFTFVLKDVVNEGQTPKDLAYYGIELLDDLKISTAGTGTFKETLRFKLPASDFAEHHWNPSRNSGSEDIVRYRKVFLLTEQNDGKAGWEYSTKSYELVFTYDIEHGDMDLDVYWYGDVREPAKFTNTYTENLTTVEIPFTKTVKLGGNTAPGKTDFELEIFDIRNSNKNEYKDVTYTAAVTTNGAGSYDGKLVISGPASQVKQFVCEGFSVCEKNNNLPGWTYSDAVWRVRPSREAEDVNGIPTKMNIYSTGNGEGAAVEQMTFENTYTYNHTTHARRTPEQPNTPETAITAPKTFDAGVALYGVSALLSLTGTALVIKRKNG